MARQPWTTRLVVSYRRSLRFYEHRYEILRSFETEGLLHEFNVKSDRVSVRLGDPYHRVSFSTNRLDAALLQPSGDVDRIESAIQSVWEGLELEQVVRPQFSFQWLVELHEDYDAARTAAAHSLLGVGSLNDFAVLSDGHIPDPPATYRLQFGIVEAEEIPARLARVRAGVAPPDEESPPSLWRPDTLPEVALFIDTLWNLEDRPNGVDQLKEHWAATENVAHGVISELMERLNLNSADE